MSVLRPDQFSGEALTEHIELEDTLSPYVDIKSYELNLEYFEAVVRHAQQLFDALFEEGDPIRIVWHVHGQPVKPTLLFRYIRDKSVRFKTIATSCTFDDEPLWMFTVPVADKSEIRVRPLLEAICYQDFYTKSKPRLNGEFTTYPLVQFIHEREGHVLFVYDDRGAYIRGTSPAHLQSLKQKISPSRMPNRT
ncbi:hypothetical protein [Exiguobacterium sp. s196]|uniref:DUF3885 domain-containing protein n=1 Tax=Exiguobacterium sp. s196 TaxID=2751283 RepID=UPI001BE9C8E5|nr:hypothetical protein [Exiguobacterium sp. s196]